MLGGRATPLDCGCWFDEFAAYDCRSYRSVQMPIELAIDPDEAGSIPDLEPIGVDDNGCPVGRFFLPDGQEVIVHFDDIPEYDKTEIDGIPCTTALRTVIDVAADVDADELRRIFDDCQGRKLFSLEQAWQRLSEADMVARPGAERLRRMLPPAV